MKRRLGREVLWMTLPVALLGGVGWWRASGGGLSMLHGAPSDLERGPARVEIGLWRDVEPLPADVARGYVVKKRVTVWQGGQSPVLTGVKRAAREYGTVENLHLVFRRGKRWQTLSVNGAVPPVKCSQTESDLGAFALRQDSECRVAVADVPTDATEVRLRGRFTVYNHYQGAACGGIQADPRWERRGGIVCTFVNRSTPFDVPVKAANQAWPAPVVSREPKIEVIGAAWFVSFSNPKQSRSFDSFALHLWHKEKRDWQSKIWIQARNFRLLDANQREVLVFDKNGAGPLKDINSFGSYNQSLFHPEMLRSDIMEPIIGSDAAPKRGWNSVKRPLWIEGEIDDGECWPTKFKVRIEERTDSEKNYGAPQTSPR